MEKDEVQEIAFKLVAAAGEAFSCFHQAVDAARAGNLDTAGVQMAEGEKCLNLAHQAQFSLLSETADGEDVPVDVVLVHGQDHLMNAILYNTVAKQIIRLYRDLASKGITFEEASA